MTPSSLDGDRRTDSPWRSPSTMPTRRSASRGDRTIRRITCSANVGHATTAIATPSAASIEPAPTVAMRATETPAISTSLGRRAAKREMTSSATTDRPSNTRSTAIEENADVKRTGVSRFTASARITSPIRNGSTLFAMKPMAIPCHSGRSGSAVPSSRRSRRRQRNTRRKNVEVAMTTARASGTGRAAEMWFQTAAHSMSRSAHQSANAEMAAPRSAGQTERRPGDGLLMARFHRERNEVEQFAQERFDLGEAKAAGESGGKLGAHLVRSFQRPPPGVAEGTNVYFGGLGDRCGPPRDPVPGRFTLLQLAIGVEGALERKAGIGSERGDGYRRFQVGCALGP